MPAEITQVTTNHGRHYKWKGEFYKSVTTIIGGSIPKPFLANWKVKLTAEAAIDMHDIVGQMVQRGETVAAVDMLKKTADRYRDNAGSRGTDAHRAIETITRGDSYKPADYREDSKPYVDGFLLFMKEHKPTISSIETTVASKNGWYAGQLDARMTVNGKTATVDYKTSKSLSDTFALQLAAYNYAEFTVVNGKRVQWEPTEWCYVLQLKPNGKYRMVEVDGSETNHKVFLAAREVYTWLQNQ